MQCNTWEGKGIIEIAKALGRNKATIRFFLCCTSRLNVGYLKKSFRGADNQDIIGEKDQRKANVCVL